MGYFSNTSYRKIIFILCFWGLVFCAYLVWNSRGLNIYQYVRLQNPGPITSPPSVDRITLLPLTGNGSESSKSMRSVLRATEQSIDTKLSAHTDNTKSSEQSTKHFDKTKPTKRSNITIPIEHSDKTKLTTVGSNSLRSKEGANNTKPDEQSNYTKSIERSNHSKPTECSNSTTPTKQINSTAPKSSSSDPTVASAVTSTKNGAGSTNKSTTQTSTSLSKKNPSSSGTASTSSSAVNGTSTDKGLPKLLCVRFSGRLGNELFEYSSTLGLALTLNRTAVFLGSTNLVRVLKNFKISSSNLSQSELQQRCNNAKGIGEVSCCKYKKEMTELDPQYDYRIGTYLQSYRYFDHHRAQILKAIAFNDGILAKAEPIVKELRQKHAHSVLVGVHIRHGDMAYANSQKNGYPLASPDYINRSLSYFNQLFPNCTFVVASDSLQWCKDNFPKQFSHIRYLDGNEPAVDMTVLAAMDHVITSFGSFSWWIGYLNGGITVYMKDFIKANTFIGDCFNPQGKDYVYPGWIPL